MTTLSKIFLPLVVISLVGCSAFKSEQDTTSAQGLSAGESVQVKEGETARISDDLTVEFVELVSDSRCASDVQCVWEGAIDASFVLHVSGREEPFSINGFLGSDGEKPLEATVGQYLVSLKRMDPYPLTTRETEETPVATLSVELR